MKMEESFNKTAFKRKGGAPKKKVKRETDIRVRLTVKEKFLIENKAKLAGMRISNWFRSAAVNGKVVARFSNEEMKIFRTLAGLANNLNQLTHLAHISGLLTVQKKCRELLVLIDEVLSNFKKDDR